MSSSAISKVDQLLLCGVVPRSKLTSATLTSATLTSVTLPFADGCEFMVYRIDRLEANQEMFDKGRTSHETKTTKREISVRCAQLLGTRVSLAERRRATKEEMHVSQMHLLRCGPSCAWLFLAYFSATCSTNFSQCAPSGKRLRSTTNDGRTW